MIIQIRGTSGSGKSTVVRRILNYFGSWSFQYIKGRKKPLFYTHSNGLVILGHYESPCGGCDTIGSARAIYDLIQRLQAPRVLCEGLLLSEDVKWSSQLDNLRALFLTTPVEVCLARIRVRRLAAGNNKPLSEKNTRNRVAIIERARVKLLAAGILCQRCSQRQAAKIILRWIKEETDA